MKCPIKVPALLFIVEIQVGHQNLKVIKWIKNAGRRKMTNFPAITFKRCQEERS